VLGQERREGCVPISAQHNLGLQIGVVDLAHELATNAAGWEDRKAAVMFVAPDGHDAADALLAGGGHRGDGAAFGAEPPARRIDADTSVKLAPLADQRCGDVAEQPFAEPAMGSQLAEACAISSSLVICGTLAPHLPCTKRQSFRSAGVPPALPYFYCDVDRVSPMNWGDLEKEEAGETPADQGMTAGRAADPMGGG
jgi:hypothetical protein